MIDLKEIEIFNRHLKMLKAKRSVSQALKLVDVILQIDGKILFIEFNFGLQLRKKSVTLKVI